MECKKLTKSDPNKNSTLAKKEAASSFSETLTAMVFISGSDYNRFSSLIAYLSQDTLKEKNNFPRTVTNAYDMLTHF